ncbi:MAG: fructose-bisphosphate aldolase class I [Actinomycetota bacterium]|nr:fructose-bisphosphate aldolase class I [Actinomycetota bacterium]MDQ6945411.1 fructose-bisphosphate aldolase class I [Actinomycetota bacterium]
MTTDKLHEAAAAMVAPGKGILAADESSGTISKRFAALGIPSTVELRRQYREALLTAPGIESHISGVILYDETIRQATSDGTPFPEVLAGRGILPGIKVDTGAKGLAGSPSETITEGLDGLRDRVAEYYELGARFAKWRAVINIGDGLPSRNALVANAHALARYAALCQEGGLVPIVEPEVLMDGDHDQARCDEVTHETLAEVFSQLRLAGIDLEGMVLKPSMVISGAKGPGSSVQEVADATVRCLRDTVPASVPGIAFLSGGQSAQVATEHLDAMNRLGPHPWMLTFSYGRALQDDPLRTWAGESSNCTAAQDALLVRARCNSEAALGQYDRALETV